MINEQTTKLVAIADAVVVNDNSAFVTASIDTLGWAYMDIYVRFGAMDIAMAALKLQTADADTGYADLSGADFSVSPATLPAATSDNTSFHIAVNLIGKKRWFDLVATAGDGAVGTYMTAWAVLSRGTQMPGTATARGFAQELLV